MASPVSTNKYYFYSESSQVVYYGEVFPENNSDLVYIGTSDNPIPASAATVFMTKQAKPSGWSVRRLPEA